MPRSLPYQPTAASWSDEPRTADLLLIDGPGAGKRVRAEPGWAATYLYATYPDISRMLQDFNTPMPPTFAGPTYTAYNIAYTRDLDGQFVRIGWSSNKPEPDPEELECWIRYEPSVKVIADGMFSSTGLSAGCSFATLVDQANATIQGACTCGWKTEAVPRRRTREVTELVDAHRRISTSVAMGMGINARAMREAIRYEALLVRAEAVGMSRSRAEEIFRGEEFSSYSFDEAAEHLEHWVHRFTMYGYMPLTARDVLTRREIDAYQIDPGMILNRPRWMPAPLGQQFAEMTSGRQRTIVEAAIEVTKQLGGAAESWPLERALAAVMPHLEVT